MPLKNTLPIHPASDAFGAVVTAVSMCPNEQSEAPTSTILAAWRDLGVVSTLL